MRQLTFKPFQFEALEMFRRGRERFWRDHKRAIEDHRAPRHIMNGNFFGGDIQYANISYYIV